MSKLLDDAITDYLTYRRTAFKKGTALASEQSLRQFLSIVGNVQTRTLMPRHAERFQTSMLTAGKKPATVNNRMSQLSAFNKWLVANRYAPAQFTGTTRMIPVPRTMKLRVPVTDFQRLLDTADRPDRRITLALGLFLFLRGGEMKTLRVQDVRLTEGEVDVVIHKTNDTDEMPGCSSTASTAHARLVISEKSAAPRSLDERGAAELLVAGLAGAAYVEVAGTASPAE